jgi:predicted amidohydrolase YtcJ
MLNLKIASPRVLLTAIALFTGSISATELATTPSGELTVFTARKIITMEPALPEASAVAVADGRIVAVGSLESLDAWINRKGARIDRRFEDKVVMPGFIDPHVHPSLPAVLTQFPFIAPDGWSLPTGEFPAATTPKAYVKELKQWVARHDDPNVPFITWGYHPLWHGDIYRDELNELFPDQPVMLWHRSFHELIGNDAAFELLGVDEAYVGEHENVDWSKGHFYETGAVLLLPKMNFIFDPQRFGNGMRNFVRMLHLGGVTTAVDMNIGIFGDPDAEIAMIRNSAESTEVPSRIILTPGMVDFIGRDVSMEDALAQVDTWRKGNSRRVLFDRRFKLMMDGAIFSGLAQFAYPGYMDGHHGVWMFPLETTTAWAQAFWDAGYQIHAHTNGDASTAAMLDVLRTLQKNTPREDHRFALEHFAYTTEDQNRKLRELGAVVSANSYYHFILSDIYSDQWLGPDRGSQMVRLGSLERLGVPFAFHSDCPMAPLEPLTLAWAATNRITINGNRTGQNERVSLDAALRAITIGAAWVIGWEDEIGSIRAGKRADFTVLEEDPYEVGVEGLRDIGIWGTVFEGEVAQIKP